MQTIKVIPAIVDATETTVSSRIWVGDYKRVAILFRRANHAAGATALSITAGFAQLPSDNPTMTTYNMLVDNVTNTNGQNYTRVASKSLSANGDAMVWMDPSAPATHIAVTLTETTDGTHSAWVIGFCD